MTITSQTFTRHHTISFKPLKSLVVRLFEIAAEMEKRRKIKASLGKLSDVRLRDIGLTRSDVLSIADLPVISNSAEILSCAGKSRARNW